MCVCPQKSLLYIEFFNTFGNPTFFLNCLSFTRAILSPGQVAIFQSAFGIREWLGIIDLPPEDKKGNYIAPTKLYKL